MADNFAITAGAGTTIGSDDVAGVHYQKIKLFDPTADSSTGLGIAANPMQVTVATALPAGTAAIGKLAANSGVDIGDVDVTSVVPGTGATNLGKAIDTALGATDTGVLALTVRDDALATLIEIDGDVSALRVSSTGRLWASATIDAALPAGTNGIGKLTANSGVDIGDVDILSIAAGDNNIGNVDIASIAAGDNNIGNVDVVSSALPTGASTAAKQPALGTAGTPSADVISVQGVSGGTVLPVAPAPSTSGGGSVYHKVSAGSDNAANVKASAGQVYGVHVYNNAAYPVYVKLHNTAGVPTAGAGVIAAFGVQAGTQRDASFPFGIAFGTGIGITIVKDIADAGATAVVASDCVVAIDYK
jgi:hypothetical protein